MVLAAVATFVGASVASATGFGFALILSPAMFAVLEPDEAVTTLLMLGLALNLLMLFGSGGQPGAIRWRAVSPMLVAAVPGLGAGVLLLALMSKPVLQIAVGIAVSGAALAQGRSGAGAGDGTRAPARGVETAREAPCAGESPREPALASACAVGLASGALTTSTTVSGPPIVLWLQAHRIPPEEFRASLAACFLGLTVAGGAVLAAADMLSLDPAVVLPLLGLTVLGQLVGTRVFRGLDAGHLRWAVLALVFAAGVASLAAGVAGLH
ncbi:MAG TPA: sulfite exporter TauE/SafE family protein [Thermoleophilaceae bacterium]|nr:sulfite exporter TauE/SafE family protein [Thermoleophilaceae bacterium]